MLYDLTEVMLPTHDPQLFHPAVSLRDMIAANCFSDTWSLNFLIFLVFSGVKIVTGIFFWVLHLVCTVYIRRFVSKVHIMCIHRNDWFDKIMPHGRGHLGNNFEIAIPINRYPKITRVLKICILSIEVRYLKKK